MAEAGTLCINADVVKAAGVNVSATYIDEAYTNVYILQAEGKVSASAKYDFVTNYAKVKTIGKEFLRQVAAAIAAMEVIKADMGGFARLGEAQTRLDVLSDVVASGLTLLKVKDYLNFLLI